MLQWPFKKKPVDASPEQDNAAMSGSASDMKTDGRKVDAAIANAAQHQGAGRYREAEAGFKSCLATNPENSDALRMLGALKLLMGQHDDAAELLSRAIALDPLQRNAYSELAKVYLETNRIEEAKSCLFKALELEPALAEAHYKLGNVHRMEGKLDAALACYKKAASINPNYSEAHNNAGVTYEEMGQRTEAIASYRKALAINPMLENAQFNLGLLLLGSGNTVEALECFNKTIALNPNSADAHKLKGMVHQEKREYKEALECFSTTIALNPKSADAHKLKGMVHQERREYTEAIAAYNIALSIDASLADAHNCLGIIFQLQGKLIDSITAFRKAILSKSDFAAAHTNLGLTLLQIGASDEAVLALRHAVAINPDFAVGYSNLLLALQYSPRCSQSELFEEHRCFAARFEAPLEPLRQAFGNTREPGRRLKIGYVSADFHGHSVAYFIEPVLASHDKSQFEVFCYYNDSIRDEVTERLEAHADHWIPCLGMTDDQLAARIRADGIDILVDLAGHTAGNRLLVFARKPAPVQVTYLGYPCTTGLKAVDFRMTDKYAEPEGMTEHLNVEKLWRLDGMFCVYRPCAVKPERRQSAELAVHPTPVLENGHITFGTINNIAKLTPPVVALWSRILRAVPGSRLLIEATAFDSDAMRADFERRFAAHGIDRERLMLLARKPEQQYVLYHRIDIVLDPFPANGGTNTCDALWMGVPVVTLAGRTFVSRMGVSIVSNAGHPDWVAQDEDAYIEKASELAQDVNRLNAIRVGLRGEVERSALMDETGFTRSLEAAYRGMWQSIANVATHFIA